MENNEPLDLSKYIADDIAKYSGISMPVKAGFLQRMLIKKLPCKKLHMNPDDEFSQPKVGPSFRVISEYTQKFVQNNEQNGNYFFHQEPLIVEKLYPDGYRILNGHHRWAAAFKLGVKKIIVNVVNMTHEAEIKEILHNSKHDKRITMDLDEVVFFDPQNMPLDQAEKPLGFPNNRFYKEKLRLGIPALFRCLERNGYDIWVYSSKYYSTDYIKSLFRKYHVNVTGIVAGMEKRKNKKNQYDKLLNEKYKNTLHIDNDLVLQIDTQSGDFKEYNIDSSGGWSKNIIEIIGEIAKNESE